MPKITLTKEEVLTLNIGLRNVGDLSGPRFSYVIARNISILKDEVIALVKAQESSKEFQEYDRKRVELARSHATKDEHGKAIVSNVSGVGKFVIEDEEEFKVAWDKLKIEYKDAIDIKQKMNDEFRTVLQEKIEFVLYSLSREELPENITAQQLSDILVLVKKDENEVI